MRRIPIVLQGGYLQGDIVTVYAKLPNGKLVKCVGNKNDSQRSFGRDTRSFGLTSESKHMKTLTALLFCSLIAGCTTAPVKPQPPMPPMPPQARAHTTPPDISIVTVVIKPEKPASNFNGYYGAPNPSWVASSNVCWTATLTYDAPKGKYIVLWTNKPVGEVAPLRIGEIIEHKKAGAGTVSFPILTGLAEHGNFVLQRVLE